MYKNIKLHDYLKIKNTKNLFLLFSLFLTPLNAYSNSSYKSIINNSKIQLTKNKINIVEGRFISQNDKSNFDKQNQKFESKK